jgi:hypothetical protein
MVAALAGYGLGVLATRAGEWRPGWQPATVG